MVDKNLKVPVVLKYYAIPEVLSEGDCIRLYETTVIRVLLNCWHETIIYSACIILRQTPLLVKKTTQLYMLNLMATWKPHVYQKKNQPCKLF